MWFVDKSHPKVLVIRKFGEHFSLRLGIKALGVLLVLLIACILLIMLSLSIGSYQLSVQQVWQVVWGSLPSEHMNTVVWEFRFPRVLVAMLVGAMLALSGSALQSATGNSLADPSLVGISQGAGMAVVLLTVLLPQIVDVWRPWLAFLGALSVAAVIQGLSWSRQGKNSIRFVLMGIGVAAFINAITSALMTYGQIDQAMSALVWLSGSINGTDWMDVSLLATWFMVLLPFILVLSRSISTLKMGEVTAISLGVSLPQLRIGLVCLAVGLAAVATAVVGPLGFIGLIAPHIAQRITHSGTGLRLLITAVVGALIVALADLLGRILFEPIQIPAGLMTALIGVPMFIFLIRRSSTGRA
ncbi:FecCD family ABC transporter permease [Marinomonas sp. TW1]|uniref:FecCD family ABC transporter permease n=1 Tax=Marinomonas sp. TW1 TaxID=1561203 RepID=UPI0007AEF5C8|nr:iron ABC transporter permease [Marinomonas sp. TW1]KZN15372.1 ferrichrome ABC transporter permease [Marinomonas sp. TW1]